jgi:hypothetical protein
MQTVSSAFLTSTAAASKKIGVGVLIAWQKAINSTYSFFTIGQSKIGGADMIKGAGGSVTFFDKYQYNNETANVASFSITRNTSSLPWGVIMAQANIKLLNSTNRYTPKYDGTIGNYILPDRPVKLSVGLDDEYVSLFTGYTDLPMSSINSRETTITAWDALKFLSNKKSALQVFVNTRADQIIIALLQEQGFVAGQYNIESSLQQNIGYLMVQDKIITDIFKDICEAEGALMFVDENGIIQFWNRLHLNSNSTSRWTFNYSNMTDINWDTTPIVNDAIVTAKPLKQVAFNKLWESGQIYTIPPSGTLDIFADFRDDVGSYPAISVVTPVNVSTAVTSSYQTNYDSDGTGSDASGVMSLSSVYLFGERYRMTFANSSGVNVYVTKIQLYGTPAKVQVIDSKEQTDATSILNYGINPDNSGQVITINNDLVQDASTANSLAYIYVKLFSAPMQRIKATVFGVPHLQLGDFVTVTEETTSQSLNMTIVGNNISVDKNGSLKQELDFEQRGTYQYFTIGVSKIGGSDYIAP